MFTICVLIIFTPVRCRALNLTNAGHVELIWERSPSDLLTNGVTYFLTASNQTTLFTTNILSGNNNALSLTNMDAGRWHFAASAVQGGIITPNTNQTLFDVPVTAPARPGQVRILFIDTTLDLVNWTPFAALRVRLP